MAWAGTHKHVPTALRNACLQRDGHRCTATMRDGTRCPEQRRGQLEAHHVNQYQPGEQTSLDNLVTLCAWHHRKITQQQSAEVRRRNPPPRNRRATKHPGML